MRGGAAKRGGGKRGPAPSNTTAALTGVNVVYCAEEAQARRLLAEMVGAGRVAIDIETAPNKTEVERLAKLMRAKAETAGTLKAKRKLKAPPAEIAALAAASKHLAVEIRYAQAAGLDPHRARIRLLQLYAGGTWALVVDLDYTGAGVLDSARRRERHRPQRGLRDWPSWRRLALRWANSSARCRRRA